MNSKQLEISDKVRQFITAMLAGKTSKEAAIAAGYNPRAAGNLMKLPEVVEALTAEGVYRDQVARNTPARIEGALSSLAFSDIGALFDEDMGLRPLHQVDVDTRAAIHTFDVEEFCDPDGKVVKRRYKVGMERKTRPIELLGNLHGMFKDAVPMQGGLHIEINAVRRPQPSAVEAEVARLPTIEAVFANLGQPRPEQPAPSTTEPDPDQVAKAAYVQAVADYHARYWERFRAGLERSRRPSTAEGAEE